MDTEGPEGEEIVLTSQHIELEQSILGTMFVNPGLIPKANENIKKYMFQVENHSMIYEGIIKMADDKKEIDLINFLENYKEIIKLMGGVSYVSEVYSCSSTDVAFETKLELLIKAYKKRIVLNLCSHVSDEMTIEDMENKLSNTLINLYNCTLKKDLNIEDIYDNYLKNLYEINKDMGVKSGLTKIDDVLGNFRRGRLITVFARSGVGKSIFSIQVAKNMALSGHNVIYGSAEMTRNQVFNRMAASHLSISSKSIDDDSINNTDKENITKYMTKLLNSSFYVSTETDFNKFINEIKVYKLQNSLDVVFVDYINKYIDFSDKDIMTNKLGKISGMLKTLAMEEDICIVLMAQANRVVDKKGGDMAIEKIDSSDIQDSARIEQDSDQVIALYRNIKLDDKMYRDALFKKGKLKYSSKNADENPECINAILIKNRHGDRGTCALKWNGRYSRVTNF